MSTPAVWPCLNETEELAVMSYSTQWHLGVRLTFIASVRQLLQAHRCKG
ncbi:MAG: hypothetical protein JW395_1918 [Nitrospira sp.]|nr:hypothetical protein [Nitrospira sp.]